MQESKTRTGRTETPPVPEAAVVIPLGRFLKEFIGVGGSLVAQLAIHNVETGEDIDRFDLTER